MVPRYFSKTALESNFRLIGPECIIVAKATFTSVVIIDVTVVLITVKEGVLNDIVKMCPGMIFSKTHKSSFVQEQPLVPYSFA